jgi:CRISPR type III-A-associated RAMP protein Csm4
MPSPGFIVRLRPSGPWRIGPESGDRERVDRIFHSDSLYSALTLAMADLGHLPEWIGATAEARTAAVRMSSCYPFAGDHLLVPPPRHLWPPPPSAKVRWKAARFVPLSVIPSLLRLEALNEDEWLVEPVSECLLPVRKNAPVLPPVRVALRVTAPVDRITGATMQGFSTACLEFLEGAGMWCLASFADEAARDTWNARLEAAFRLLADTGLGGERSRGWGRSEWPEFTAVSLPEFIVGDTGVNGGGENAWWLLSLFTPAEGEAIDWSRGAYSLVIRSGRIESRARSGEEKLSSRMVEEGSVLFAESAPEGSVRNVAPAEFPHPVYRSGFTLAVPIPWRVQS